MSSSPLTSPRLSFHVTSNLPAICPSSLEPASTPCAKPILNELPDYVAPETAGPNNTYMPASPTSRVYLERETADPAYMLRGLHVPDSLNMADITTASSAYATETCQIIHAEAFIAERRYRQLLIAAQAYKLHMLQLRRNSQQARRDVRWFASDSGVGMGYNPDWCAHHGIDGAKPFPGVAYNADSAVVLGPYPPIT
ncbi:hypothetical protein PILCRDRAFT_354949 [Piloderma croceum F 1598]|uniref:Uncharacterized protein n=1 Tax=Piloderma croceum (strain F 1598) TaxID=765440 RepID=A0A0C3G3S1_PILCF|nr:hypothetical protein PILCRDRAFT_354949 [Piloderma croceum F 1598]